jgi:glycosyltransferase involved in cell wall biosynthesis
MAEQSIPMVSVLITSYNRANYIGATLESVLASHFTDFEVIVSDDASSDNTVEIARTYAGQDDRIRVFVNEQNLGDYPNRNKAASHAAGKYIKYVDSDDILYPHALTVMVDGMERFPEAGFGLSSHPDPKTPYPVMTDPHQTYLEHFSGFSHFDRAPGKDRWFQRAQDDRRQRMLAENCPLLSIGQIPVAFVLGAQTRRTGVGVGLCQTVCSNAKGGF